MTALIMRRLLSIIITALLVLLAWYLWNEVPGWLRGTVLSDYSLVASLAAVIVVLSVLDPLIARVAKHTKTD